MYDHVTYCGDGWFSKVDPPNVDAAIVCMANGYTDIDYFGGNSGNLCGNYTTGSGKCCWDCGYNCGTTMDWHCVGGGMNY